VAKVFPIVNNVTCYLLDTNILIAVDNSNNLIWSGCQENLITRWGFFSAYSGQEYVGDVKVQDQLNILDQLINIYSLNDEFIYTIYREAVYDYDYSLGIELDQAIELSYQRDIEIINQLNQIYNLQEQSNDHYEKKIKNWVPDYGG